MSDKMRNLLVRTLSGAVLTVVVVGAVLWSQWSFGVLLLAILVGGMWVLPDGPPGGYLPSQMARTGYGYGSFRGEFPAGGFCGAGGVVAESAFRPLVVVAGFYFAHTTDVRL